MSGFHEWDPTPISLTKMPALELPEIQGLRAWEGKRNPLTRSNTARRVSMSLSVPALAGQRKVMLFESNAEFAAALELLLDPELYNLEAQLPAVEYQIPGRKWQKHSFDLRATYRDGSRVAFYVKNSAALARTSIQAEIAAIIEHTPLDFCDEIVVVDGGRFTRTYITNLLSIWQLMQEPDAEVDAHVYAMAQEKIYWDVKGLLAHCHLPSPGTGWRAVMRLIGKGLLEADRYAMIGHRSRVWLTAA